MDINAFNFNQFLRRSKIYFLFFLLGQTIPCKSSVQAIQMIDLKCGTINKKIYQIRDCIQYNFVQAKNKFWLNIKLKFF